MQTTSFKSDNSCSKQPNERVYYLIVLFLGVILPIGVSYLANIGVVRQLISDCLSPSFVRFKFIFSASIDTRRTPF